MSAEKPAFIDKQPASVLSFDALRQEGIALLQQLSGNVWTDYNLHDPGVTILEQLCFAITDLAYRGDFSIEELLTEDNGLISHDNNSFLDSRKILSSNPVTINDFRKIVLDQNKDVENVWLEPVKSNSPVDHVNGVYTVKIKLKEDTYKETHNAGHDTEVRDEIRSSVTAILNNNRNIGERFDDVFVLKSQKIKVKARITIKDNSVAEDVLSDIYMKITDTLYPRLTFHKDTDLLIKGSKVTDIYTGPLLKNGIILDEELKPLRETLEIAEFIDKILQLDDVLFIKSLTMSLDGQNDIRYCKRDPDSFFVLDDENFDVDITLVNSNYEHSINKSLYKSFLRKKINENIIPGIQQRKDLAIITNRLPYRNIGQYYSIQHHFPQVYGISKEGLELHVTEKRKAEAKQLKGYLMLFEQVLANHLAQLDNVKHLFSVEKNTGQSKTLFSQPLYDVPGAADIIKAFGESTFTNSKNEWGDFTDRQNAYTLAIQKFAESPAENKRRRNAMIDHLLARYNETISVYPILSFNKHYYLARSVDIDDDIIAYKSNFFNLLETYGRHRATINNETGSQVPGYLELRLMSLLNIRRCYVNKATMDISFEQVEQQYSKKLTDALKIQFGSFVTATLPSDDGATSGTTFNFLTQRQSFLKEALNPDNFSIDEENSLYFRGRRGIQQISSHSSAEHANEALNGLIRYLTVLNINSEGFHIVEHVLLAPALQDKRFGFRYVALDDPHHPIHKNLSFAEREKEMARVIRKNEQSATRRNVDGSLNLFVNIEDDTKVQEDFFNLQITVALPSWPARFQDKDFRQFIVKTFQLNIPAHIRINFRWLNIADMNEFETHFFDWKSTGNYSLAQSSGVQLIKLLAKEYINDSHT